MFFIKIYKKHHYKLEKDISKQVTFTYYHLFTYLSIILHFAILSKAYLNYLTFSSVLKKNGKAMFSLLIKLNNIIKG